MATLLDPLDIYDRGIHDLSCLQGVERLVFMLMDFDYLMDMESWDHFFIHEWHFIQYAEMKDWLRTIGDEASLAVLEDYEAFLKSHGVAVSSREIESFWNSHEYDAHVDAYLPAGALYWEHPYRDLSPVRWAKATAYLEARGLRLRTKDDI
jgi:hypothetical protein